MRLCCKFPQIIRAALAEFIGTYVLVVIGNGSIAQSHLSKGEKGDYFTINWGWALGCSLGILVSANASGGHLNPAVTMALALARDFPWKKLPIYWLAQYLGSLAASATVLGIYYDKILQGKINNEFRIRTNGSEPGMAVIFSNYPSHETSVVTGLVEEILSTAIFMLVICVTTDKKFSKVPNHLQPFYIGFTLLAMGVSYGSIGGYALNPARDLAPRLVSYLGGWGLGVFSFREYNWFWIFLVGPHVGAILGVGVFHLVLLKTDETSERSNNEWGLVGPSVAMSYVPELNRKALGLDFRLPATRKNESFSWKSRTPKKDSISSSIA